MTSHIPQPWTDFACRIVILRLLELNIKARQDIPEFMNDAIMMAANLYWYILLHLHRLELKCFFPSHNDFCSMLLEQLILCSRKSNGWLVSNTVNDWFGEQITQKLFKSKIEARPFQAGIQDDLHGSQPSRFICSGYQFGCKLWLPTIQNHAIDCFQAFAHRRHSHLFAWNLSRHPFLGQVVFLDLLLCAEFYSEHSDLFLCPNFTQRQWRIKRLSELWALLW